MSSLSISIIQTSLYWLNKPANLQMLQQKIETIKNKTEIIVLPEMFSTGFTMKPEGLAEKMDGPTLQWMKEMAKKNRIILTGSLIIKEKGHYFNRLIWMLPNGTFGQYDKRHLFAFAGENEHYMAGTRRLIASVKGWKINLQICYDLRFPVWTRQSPAAQGPEYDILINVANWPRKRSSAWNTLLKARAIENQCFVVGVNRVGQDGNGHLYDGNSVFLDPLGEVLFHQASSETVQTITIHKDTLTKARKEFPFLRDADGFLLTDHPFVPSRQ